MTKPDLQVNFRMPADLKAQLEEAARQNNRSTTAEVVARLQESFDQKADPRSLESRIAATELRAMTTELSLSAAVFQLLQQLPKQDAEVESTARALSQEMLDRIASYGDIQARLDELLSQLPTEKRGDTPSPTAKRPLRKTGKPLGMDQAEWEAALAAEQTTLTTAVKHKPDLKIPTTVRPERRIRRKGKDE